jgi:hypothetical protein
MTNRAALHALREIPQCIEVHQIVTVAFVYASRARLALADNS